MHTTYSVTLPVFSGPLDLLLQLIEREELDITKVALAQVTDQYLAHLRQIEEQQIQEIAEFLVIAAKLILIKSETLLPRAPTRDPEEADPGDELARLLLAYKKYKEIADLLHTRQAAGMRTFLRLAAPPKPEPTLDLSHVTTRDLWTAMMDALTLQTDDALPVSLVVTRPRVTIGQQIKYVVRTLRASGRASFFDLLRTAQTRTEIIVTFLAVLELVKQQLVAVRQEQNFGDIEITSQGDWIYSDEIEITSELEAPAESVSE